MSFYYCRKYILFLYLLLLSQASVSQNVDSFTDSITSLHNKRTWEVTAAHVGLWTGSFIVLNQMWYADYEKSGFHFFNDNREWLQMDKWGHVWTANQLSRVSAETWKWAGMDHSKATWLGGISGWAFQAVIEIQDGFSKEWGFSWGDFAANTVGSASYIAQQLAWKEERILIKLSYTPHQPADPILKQRSEELFGATLYEKLLKDYNAQTYWLSFNINSLFQLEGFPKWLNISLGYGAQNLYGGKDNQFDLNNGSKYNFNHLTRQRLFYLSPDIDLTKIPTRKKWLKTIFFALNSIKVPAPALQLSQNGGIKGHWMFF